MSTLKKMQFKDYIWPYNPRNFTMSRDKIIIQHKYPNIDGADLEDLGNNPRVFSGDGEFFGDGAYDEFKKLNKVYEDSDSGYLIHPNWGKFNVEFSKLYLTQEPTPSYVSYSFEFIEDKTITIFKSLPKSSNSSSSSKPSSSTYFYYTIKKGDTLWDLASKYLNSGLKWRDIANLNKTVIKDPHWIYPGQKIKIPK